MLEEEPRRGPACSAELGLANGRLRRARAGIQPRVHRSGAGVAADLGPPSHEPAPEEPRPREQRGQSRDRILPGGARHPSPSALPPWNTAKEATQASAFIMTTMKIGQLHELVSRRTTATVDMHWQASTKKTMRLTAMRGE